MCQKSDHSENAIPAAAHLALTEIVIHPERLEEFAAWISSSLEKLEQDWNHFTTRQSRRRAERGRWSERGDRSTAETGDE